MEVLKYLLVVREKKARNNMTKGMNDKEQIQLLKNAIDAYESGEILESKDMAIEFINNITDFVAESEDKE